MARVHDVDPQLIERTRTWLLSQQQPDGSWRAEPHMLNDGLAGSIQRPGVDSDLASTAYIAWSVFSGNDNNSAAARTRQFLTSHDPAMIADPNTLALVCNALIAVEPTLQSARPYLARLESLKMTSPDGKQVWWQQSVARRTMFYGAGHSGSIETTALASLALLAGGQSPATVRSALAWLIAQKDGAGAWHTTQATVLALKALIAGTGQPLGEERQRRIEVVLEGQPAKQIVIPKDQAEVVQQIDLTAEMTAGNHRLSIREPSGTGSGYQVVFSHYRPQSKAADEKGPLSIELEYDRDRLTVDDTLTARATITNRSGAAAPMIVLDLPIPAGFALLTEDLSALEEAGTIAKYQTTPTSAIVYLRALVPQQPLSITYRLRAILPVKVNSPPVVAYEYYAPDRKAQSSAQALTILAR